MWKELKKKLVELTHHRGWIYSKTKLGENKGFISLILLLVALRWSIIDHYRVPTGSMIPTIEIGDMVLVNKLAYDIRMPFTDWILFQNETPKHGDIVVFKYPMDTSMNFVKRLVGLPGDELEIEDGIIHINGRENLNVQGSAPQIVEKLFNASEMFQYQEHFEGKNFTVQRLPAAFQDATRRGQYPPYQKYVVPEGLYFMMGDNRDNSADSRFWGFVPRDYFKGKALRVTLSITFGDYYLPHFDFTRFGKKLI